MAPKINFCPQTAKLLSLFYRQGNRGTSPESLPEAPGIQQAQGGGVPCLLPCPSCHPYSPAPTSHPLPGPALCEVSGR